jgi:hypothetical protein
MWSSAFGTTGAIGARYRAAKTVCGNLTSTEVLLPDRVSRVTVRTILGASAVALEMHSSGT